MKGADGIVDVARAMEEVEYLAGLSDGAEQRIVGAVALALLVEADGGAFRSAAGGLDRAVEVERDSAEVCQAQSIEDQGAKEAAGFVRALGVGTGERAADGGDIGETGQTQKPSDHRIVLVEAQFPKSAVAEQEVDDEEQHHGVVAEDRAQVEVAETGSQPFLDVELGEEGLEDDQARERGECLVFEPDVGKGVKLAMDGGSARLHAGGLFLTGGLFLANEPYQSGDHLSTFALSSLIDFYHCPRIEPLQSLLDFTKGEVQPQTSTGIPTASPTRLQQLQLTILCN